MCVCVCMCVCVLMCVRLFACVCVCVYMPIQHALRLQMLPSGRAGVYLAVLTLCVLIPVIIITSLSRTSVAASALSGFAEHAPLVMILFTVHPHLMHRRACVIAAAVYFLIGGLLNPLGSRGMPQFWQNYFGEDEWASIKWGRVVNMSTKPPMTCVLLLICSRAMKHTVAVHPALVAKGERYELQQSHSEKSFMFFILFGSGLILAQDLIEAITGTEFTTLTVVLPASALVLFAQIFLDRNKSLEYNLGY
ncbi:hypothetical protein ES703_117396 [subsurface metagenome]